MNFYADKKTVVDAVITARAGNFHTIQLKSGINIPNIFSNKRFPVGAKVKACRSQFGNYYILSERTFTYPKQSIDSLYIVTYNEDDPGNEKVLRYKLNNLQSERNLTLPELTDGSAVPLDIAALKNTYSTDDYEIVEYTDEEYESVTISASSESQDCEAVNLLDFLHPEKYWRSIESEGLPQEIIIECGSLVAIEIELTTLEDTPKEFSIRTAANEEEYPDYGETVVEETNCLADYDYPLFYEGTYTYFQGYVKIIFSAANGGSGTVSIQKIRLFKKDFETSAQGINKFIVQPEDGLYNLMEYTDYKNGKDWGV